MISLVRLSLSSASMNLHQSSWTTSNLVVSTSLFFGSLIGCLLHSKKSISIGHPNSIISQQIIKKFVLTGGPCSGKTTSMEKIQVFLRERGFRVFVATGNVSIPKSYDLKIFRWLNLYLDLISVSRGCHHNVFKRCLTSRFR